MVQDVERQGSIVPAHGVPHQFPVRLLRTWINATLHSHPKTEQAPTPQQPGSTPIPIQKGMNLHKTAYQVCYDDRKSHRALRRLEQRPVKLELRELQPHHIEQCQHVTENQAKI